MTKAAELAKMGEVLTNSQIGGRRNIVINGAMQVAQRATSATGVGDTNSVYPTLDRFAIGVGNSAGRFTMSQSTVTDLEGFTNALKIDVTTADTSIATNEFLIIQHKIEGFDVQQLKATSTSTKTFTISFYAKSNESRALNLEARFSNGTNRQAVKTITTGTSWARYTMTVNAASNTQIDNDNSNEMQLNFWLHAGSTYSGGTPSTTLGATENTARGAGVGSIYASTDNTLEITGVQLEVGSQATPFEHRSFGEELLLCKRYFQKINSLQCVATTNTSERLRINATLVPSMRAGPSFTIISGVVTKMFGGETAIFSADTSIAQSGALGAEAIQVDIDNFSTSSNGDGSGTTPVDNACFIGHSDQLIYECDSEL